MVESDLNKFDFLSFIFTRLLDGHYWYVAGLIGPHLGAIIGLLLFRLSCDHRLPATSSQENGNHRPSQIANNQHGNSPF